MQVPHYRKTLIQCNGYKEFWDAGAEPEIQLLSRLTRFYFCGQKASLQNIGDANVLHVDSVIESECGQLGHVTTLLIRSGNEVS